MKKTSFSNSLLNEKMKPYLMEVAYLYFVERLSIHQIIKALSNENTDCHARKHPSNARKKVASIEYEDLYDVITYLEKNEMVRISIFEEPRYEGAHECPADDQQQFHDLNEALLSAFQLRGVALTSGCYNEIWQDLAVEPDAEKIGGVATSLVMHDIGRTAGQYISDLVHEKVANENTSFKINNISVGPGRAVNIAMNHIHPIRQSLGVMPNMEFISFRRVTEVPLDTVRQLESAHEGRFSWMACPAFLIHKGDENFVQLYLQQPVMKVGITRLHQTDLLITSVSSVPPVNQWLQDGLIDEKVYEAYNDLRSCLDLNPNSDASNYNGDERIGGSIVGCMFNEKGEDFETFLPGLMPWRSIGINMQLMENMVSKGKPVVLVTGGDPAKVKSIHILIKTKKVNHLITDTTTARALLRLEGIEWRKNSLKPKVKHYWSRTRLYGKSSE